MYMWPADNIRIDATLPDTHFKVRYYTAVFEDDLFVENLKEIRQRVQEIARNRACTRLRLGFDQIQNCFNVLMPYYFKGATI